MSHWALATSIPLQHGTALMRHSCRPDLADTGSRAPNNCTGSGRPGRDDPRDAPVSADQGSTGLSRPGTECRGVPHVTYNKDTRLEAVACSGSSPPILDKGEQFPRVICMPAL